MKAYRKRFLVIPRQRLVFLDLQLQRWTDLIVLGLILQQSLLDFRQASLVEGRGKARKSDAGRESPHPRGTQSEGCPLFFGVFPHMIRWQNGT